jgi:hypothetical protein
VLKVLKKDLNLSIPLNCLRLRHWDKSAKVMAKPISSDDCLAEEDIEPGTRVTLTLESKLPQETWKSYNPNEMILRLLKYNPSSDSFHPIETLSVLRDSPLPIIIAQIASALRLDMPKVFTYVQGTLTELRSTDSTLRQEGVRTGQHIYVEEDTYDLDIL